jgi:hypothetical protein
VVALGLADGAAGDVVDGVVGEAGCEELSADDAAEVDAGFAAFGADDGGGAERGAGVELVGDVVSERVADANGCAKSSKIAPSPRVHVTPEGRSARSPSRPERPPQFIPPEQFMPPIPRGHDHARLRVRPVV